MIAPTPGMIKSKTMNRKILIILVLALLLAGCGKQTQPELQPFEGETVATLQTPFSLMDEASITENEDSLPASGETALPAALEPTRAPEDEQAISPVITQTNPNPYLIETTQPNPLSSATIQTTVTPAPTLGTPVWEGTWNIWYQNSTGAYASSVINIQVSSGQISATATFNDTAFTFTGEFNADGDEVKGKWESQQNVGDFWWQMIYPNTFVGSRDARFGFCGDRVSSDRPASCRKMSPN